MTLFTLAELYNAVIVIANVVIAIANVVIAIAAVFALRQIDVAKLTLKTNSKREAVKLATELVKYFLTDCIDQMDKSYEYQKKYRVASYDKPSVTLKKFDLTEAVKVLPKEEIAKAYRRGKQVSTVDSHRELAISELDEMNKLEVYATPFISGVADDDTGFSSNAKTFCRAVEQLWFEYVFLRSGDEGDDNLYFKNTISLYNCWKPRLEKSKLQQKSNEINEQIEKIIEVKNVAIGT